MSEIPGQSMLCPTHIGRFGPGRDSYTATRSVCTATRSVQKERPPFQAVSPRTNRMFVQASRGCALSFFNREAASDSVEHGHLSLLDRCYRIVDGERRLFVQQLGIIMHRSKPHRYSIRMLTLSPESCGGRDALLFGERRVNSPFQK